MASALVADAPLTKSERAIATAAYEHEDEAAPSASPGGNGSLPAQGALDGSRGTHACTIAEMAKPSTSAHHTSQAMRSASRRPCHRKSRRAVIASRLYP